MHVSPVQALCHGFPVGPWFGIRMMQTQEQQTATGKTLHPSQDVIFDILMNR